MIEEKKIVDLPLNGCNFAQLGTLTPGVVPAPNSLGGLEGDATGIGFGNPTGSFAVNGQGNQMNNFIIDGMFNNDGFNTGFALRPPPDAIQEFKIQTHSYGAEYGLNAGAVVNVATKAGSNNIHGSIWEFHRNGGLQSTNFFATEKPELTQNQFGASFGGPLRKNKLFFFGYYEGFRNTEGQTRTRTVLSGAERNGDFSQSGTTIIDPFTGAPFPGNVIPPSRLHPSSVALLDEFVPLPNSEANRFTRSPPREDDRDQFGLRLDYHLDESNMFLFRWLRSKVTQFNPLATDFSPEGSAGENRVRDFMGSFTHIFDLNKINQFRISHNDIDAKPNTTSGTLNSEFGLDGIPNTQPTALGLANINIIGFFSLGDFNQPFAKRDNEVLQIRDDFTWITGRHSLKFGADVRRHHMFLAFTNRPNGNPVFDGSYTDLATADFLLGFMRQFRQGGGDPEKNGTQWGFAGYVHDEFRVSSNVMLSLGLRYELLQPWIEKEDRVNGWNPGQQSTVRPAAPVGLVYPGDEGVPRGIIPTDKNNFAPRVGVAWDESSPFLVETLYGS